MGWNQTVKVVAVVLGLCLAYAIIRYNLVRDVSFTQLPLYIANKSIALGATLIIGLSYLFGPFARFWPKIFVPLLYQRKHLGITGFALAALHAIMSIILISPAYYGRLYEDNGKLTGSGEMMLLFGILAFAVFSAIAITSLPPIEKHMHPDQWKRVQRFGYMAYLMVLVHVTVLGFKGWLRPDSWQYGLMSISLIAALSIVLVLIVRLLATGHQPSKQAR